MAHATTQIREALTAAIARQRAILTASWTPAAAGDERAVHRARVASRRLREALAIAAAAAGSGEEANRARRATRRVTRALGPVREIDVALTELDPVAKRHGWCVGATVAIRRSLDRARTVRRRDMRRRVAEIGRGTLRARVGRASVSVADQPGHADVRRALVDHLAGRADRVMACAARCGTLYSVERLHALRIAVKKLRYTLEIAEGVADTPMRVVIGMLKGAQRRLGRLHDAQVLLGAIQSAAGAARGTQWDWQAMVDDLERECRERHAEIVGHLTALTDAVHALKQEASVTLRTGRRTMAKAESAAPAGRSATGPRRAIDRSA